jgi:prepilin-type N-terminal cleavage/methylation domain-containing protein
VGIRYRTPILDRRGMTLIEMMIALSMFAIVMGVVFSFMRNSRRSYDSTSERAEYQQSVRATISLLTRELRSAGCDPSDSGFDHFSLAGDTSIRLQMDLNGDGDTSDSGPDEDVTWQYDPATETLQRNGGLGAVTVLRGVTGVQFSYFDDEGNSLALTPLSPSDRDQIRFVDVEIMGESGTGEEVVYGTRVLVRNE